MTQQQRPALLERLAAVQVLRFLLSGGVNTLLTYALYLLLLTFCSYQLSYTIAFASGILLAYILNRTFVFRSHRGLHSVVWMPLTYLAQYLVGLLATWIWVDAVQLDERLAPLAAIALTLPLNYFLSRFAFTKRPADQ